MVQEGVAVPIAVDRGAFDILPRSHLGTGLLKVAVASLGQDTAGRFGLADGGAEVGIFDREGTSDHKAFGLGQGLLGQFE